MLMELWLVRRGPRPSSTEAIATLTILQTKGASPAAFRPVLRLPRTRRAIEEWPTAF